MNRGSNDNFSLYIPRVALSSSGSSSKSSSRSKEFVHTTNRVNGEISAASGESESEGIYGSSIQNYDGTQSNRQQMYLVHKAPKRGSHSTQSSSLSSSSNQSIYNINSLLLSARNFEKSNRPVEKSRVIHSEYENFNEFPFREQRIQMMQNIKDILAIDNYSITSEKPKEVDEISTISSTNFTVITNDFNNPQPSKSRAICRRSHQVTILILVMILVMLIGIFGGVCMLEMRYAKMPK